MKQKAVMTTTLTREQNKIAFLSDLHWDNPKTDLKLLKKHLDYCKANGIKIFLNGDTYCLMQGRGDRRSNKSDIRPEHNNAFYFDSIVDTAVEWFKPYAHLIIGVGYGNHETGIIKHQETDILKRWVEKLNYKTGSQIQLGGYGGWIVVQHEYYPKHRAVFKVKYFHGSGGGGIVTKGAINLTRALETYEDFDLFTMGHIHENAARNDVRDYIYQNSHSGQYEQRQKQIHLMLTGTYKEEYGEGVKGWHVERGAPPKPLGGRIAVFQAEIKRNDGKQVTVKEIDSYKFPI